jgi:proteasome lid subunit RPN8/RPN11
MEQMVGFFDRMVTHHGAEAAALIVLEEETGCVRFHVPPQTAQVGVTRRGRQYPIGLTYETDSAPPEGHVVLGDIHSHCYAAAYSSATDRHDEIHRPGLHIVVGCLDWEPPQFRCEFVVDGTRFTVEEDRVLEGYTRRRYDVPEDWKQRVHVEVVGEQKRQAWWGSKDQKYGDRDAAGEGCFEDRND